MGVGDTYALSELPVKFTAQNSFHTYLADVNFHIKVLVMKIIIIFQKFFKIFTLVLSQEEFYILFIFKWKKCIIWGGSLLAISKKEGDPGIFQRSLAEGHFSADLQSGDLIFYPHLEELNKQQLTGVTQVWLRLAPVSLAKIWLSCLLSWRGLPPINLSLSACMWVAEHI